MTQSGENEKAPQPEAGGVMTGGGGAEDRGSRLDMKRKMDNRQEEPIGERSC